MSEPTQVITKKIVIGKKMSNPIEISVEAKKLAIYLKINNELGSKIFKIIFIGFKFISLSISKLLLEKVRLF
jgi:hypothetical protein